MPAPPRSTDLPVRQAPADRASRIPYPLFFLLYGAFAIYFYFTTIVPYLASSDLFAPRVLADAITYEAICVSGSYYLDMTTLRDIGPCIGLRVFSYNSGPLSIFNATIMVVTILWLSKVFRRPWKPMLALVMINPITFLSIFGPNKEVFGLVAFTTLAIFIHSRSLLALAVCLVAALFTRLPTFVVTAVYCLMLVSVLPRSGRISVTVVRRYYLIIAAMLVVTSAVAALFGSDLQYNLLGDLSRTDDISQSTALSLSIDSLSRIGLYVVVYVARLLLNLYSGVIGAFNLLSGNGANYYTVGVAGSSLLFIAISMVAIVNKGSEDMKQSAMIWSILLFVAMFTLLICLSPVIQHRYFYPIYIFLLLFVVKRDESLKPAWRNASALPISPVVEPGEWR